MGETTYTSKYPIFTVTVDLVLFRESPDNKGTRDVLLIKRGEEPFKGRLALPGGHLEIDEKAIDGAIRECREETGVSLQPKDLRLVCMLDAPDRDPRGRYISFVYTAMLREPVELKAGDDAEWAGWLSEVSAGMNRHHLAFDHAYALTRAQGMRLTQPT